MHFAVDCSDAVGAIAFTAAATHFSVAAVNALITGTNYEQQDHFWKTQWKIA